MELTILLFIGALLSVVAAGMLLLSTRTALRTGTVAAEGPAGGYRRDEQPLSYWYFVSLSAGGSVAFIGLALFTIAAAASQ